MTNKKLIAIVIVLVVLVLLVLSAVVFWRYSQSTTENQHSEHTSDNTCFTRVENGKIIELCQ